MPNNSPFTYKRDWFCRLAQYIMMLSFGSIPICAVIVAKYYCQFYPNNFSVYDIPVLLGSIIIFTIIILSIKQKITIKRHRLLIVVSFALGNIAMAISLLHFDTQPCSDYLRIYNAAQQIVNGTFDTNPETNFEFFYLYKYRYQTGITVFESLVFKTFGVGMLPLQIINLIIINATFFLTYVLAYRKTGKDAAVIALFLMCTYYPIIVTVNQFTNQHLACLMILVALIAIDYSTKWYVWIGIGVLMALTNVVRPLGILLITTALVYAIYIAVKQRSYAILVSFITLLVSYEGVIYGFDQLFIKMGYARSPVSQQLHPYYKFEMGLLGNYDCEEYSDEDDDKFNREERDRIIDAMIHDTHTVLKYMTTKMIRYQGEMDWKVVHTYNHDNSIHERQPYRGWIMLGWAQYIVMGTLALAGYWQWRRRNALDIFQIFYIGNFLVYFLIEAFSSYRYEEYPIMIMFASVGLLSIVSNRT